MCWWRHHRCSMTWTRTQMSSWCQPRPVAKESTSWVVPESSCMMCAGTPATTSRCVAACHACAGGCVWGGGCNVDVCVAEQAMCRSYRFGQQRPVHVYRLVGSGTMERTIFNQQIRKERLLRTVVDERGVARHFTQRYVAGNTCGCTALSVLMAPCPLQRTERLLRYQGVQACHSSQGEGWGPAEEAEAGR